MKIKHENKSARNFLTSMPKNDQRVARNTRTKPPHGFNEMSNFTNEEKKNEEAKKNPLNLEARVVQLKGHLENDHETDSNAIQHSTQPSFCTLLVSCLSQLEHFLENILLSASLLRSYNNDKSHIARRRSLVQTPLGAAGICHVFRHPIQLLHPTAKKINAYEMFP